MNALSTQKVGGPKHTFKILWGPWPPGSDTYGSNSGTDLCMQHVMFGSSIMHMSVAAVEMLVLYCPFGLCEKVYPLGCYCSSSIQSLYEGDRVQEVEYASFTSGFCHWGWLRRQSSSIADWLPCCPTGAM